jgi:hypothetical protein
VHFRSTNYEVAGYSQLGFSALTNCSPLFQNAISKELKNPKELITTTFSEEQIGFVQNGAELAAGVLLVGSLAMVARALWKTYKGDSAEEARLLDN